MANLTSIFDFLSMKDICNKDTVPSMRRFKHPNSPKTSLFNGPFIQISSIPRKSMAFSLVELLMALLVASLLMAALAPVMTKKFGENVIVSSLGGGVRGDYSRTFYKDFEWTVPNGVNTINITSIGGGGAGGGATYGYQEFTSTTNNWTVPDGVTKIRVFMTGAGGGGASGGRGKGSYYSNRKAGSTTITQSIASNWDIVPNVKTSNVPQLCIDAGNYEWSLAKDTTVTVKACGGGGGGGGGGNQGSTAPRGGGGGGSGGYINKQVTIPQSISTVSVAIGGGGGGGGSNDGHGAPGQGWGGAGGGSGIYNTTNHATGIAPGGNGGYIGTRAENGIGTAGGGAAGGSNSGYGTLEGGGGGGGGSDVGSGGGGGGATFFGRYAYSTTTDKDFFLVAPGGGGGGGGVDYDGAPYLTGAGGGGGGAGGGKGGALGTSVSYGGSAGTGGNSGANTSSTAGAAGGTSPIGNSGYCAGGNGSVAQLGITAASGKNGYMEISWGALENALKCDYNQPANSGAGGGAGQIWIGEISVTPGQKLNFNIGIGGEGTNSYGESGYGRNGGNGGSTSIVSNSNTLISVSGGRGGKYESDDTFLNQSYGLGGGIKTSNVDSSYAKYVNWKSTNFHNGGENGGIGKTPDNGAGGGRGGILYGLDGSILRGGSEGGAQSNGGDAPSDSYGAGGGGGGGVINYGGTPGHGGKGANGYIYIEWGNSNGGGGSSGQVVTQKNVWVTAGTKIQITVGKGGEAKDILTTSSDGVLGQFGQKGNDGSDSFITTNEGIKGRAKGGIGGYPGTTNHGKGGNSEGSVSGSGSSSSDNLIPNIAPGLDGTDEYGGRGGSITSELCPLFTSIEGLGGCGGCMLDNDNNMCLDPSSTGNGKNAGKVGGGGGGGAVKDNQAYKGGKGADGMVVIEWSN